MPQHELLIKTTDRKFYRQFLEIMKSIPPFSNLRPRELDVLAEIMYQNNKYQELRTEIRSIVVFSTDVRKEMREHLNVSEDVFNNNISILRKTNLLQENRLSSFLNKIVFDGEFNLIFNFKSNE